MERFRVPAVNGWVALLFALAVRKARTGKALDSPVLRTEGGSPPSTGCRPSPSWSAWSSTPRSAGGGPIPPPATRWATTALGRPTIFTGQH